MNRFQLVEHLAKRMTDDELVLLLNDVFIERNRFERARRKAQRTGYEESRSFLLALRDRQIYVENETERVEQQVSFIAMPDPNGSYRGSPGCGICEHGGCERCQIDLHSPVKDALCPICDSKVGCT